MILSSRTPGPLSLATTEPRKPSVFRPPPRFVKAPAPKSALAPAARPWQPERERERERGPRPVPPPALGGASPGASRPSPQPPSIDSVFMLSGSSCSSLSPLSATVKTRSHSFTDEATEACVYPHSMFMSVRRDAAHTPHGVLIWAVRKYIEVPSLRIPEHLQLSLHEAVSPDDGIVRGAIGLGLKGRLRAKPIRMTHHKVMSILSRITPQKYDALREELMMLPLRQANDEELKEITKVVFEKALQEPEYSALYARLARDIGHMEDERERNERTLARRFFRQIIMSCEEQFQRPLQLSADDLVDRTTGEALCAEEADMKRDRLKHRLVGNIRFIAELFNMGVVAEDVIKDIVHVLVGNYDPADPLSKEEYVFEGFVTLIRHTGDILKDVLPLLLAYALGVAKTIEQSHPKPRVQFLMMDLDDLNRKNEWIPEATVQKHVRVHRKTPPPQSPKQVEQKVSLPASPKDNAGKVAHPHQNQNQQKSLCRYQQQEQRQQEKEEEISSEVKSLSVEKEVENGVSQSCNAPLNVSPLRDGVCSSLATRSRSLSISSSTATTTRTTSTAPNKDSIKLNNSATDNQKDVGDMVNDTRKSSKGATKGRHRSQHEPYGSLVLTCVTDLNASTSSNLCQMNSPAVSARAFSDSAGILSSRVRHGSEFGGSSCQMSEGLRSPWTGAQSCTAPLTETVNMRDVTRQLMVRFRAGGSEQDAVALRLREMGLGNAIVCFTWWLRLAATHTSLFEDRSRIAALFSALLRTGACDASSLYSTVLEWLHFDMEKGEYGNCPRMFDNVAQMILQCHQPFNDALPHIGVIRGMLHCGLMNAVLRDLSMNGGIDKMVTAVKSFHPVYAQVLQYLHEPEDERLILRVAAQNRFRLLPYLLSVRADGVATPDTPGSSLSVRPVSLSPMRNSSSCDTFASTGHYDPLSQCLVFPRVSDDAEFTLFRRAREFYNNNNKNGDDNKNSTRETLSQWRDEAVQMALTGGSTVGQLVAVMRVVGALLVAAHVSRYIPPSAVDEVVAGILAQQQGILFQGAVMVELIAFHTQSIRGSGEEPPERRKEKVKRTFEQWGAAGIINCSAALHLLETFSEANDENRVYEIFYDHITDLSWKVTLDELRGVV